MEKQGVAGSESKWESNEKSLIETSNFNRLQFFDWNCITIAS